MVTGISAINDRFTELVSRFLAQGYSICTNTMSGCQSDAPIKVDMYKRIPNKKGCEFIRVFRDREITHWDSEAAKMGYDGDIYIVAVMYGKLDRTPRDCGFGDSVYNSQLKCAIVNRWYSVGKRSNRLGYTTDINEAIACENKHMERLRAKCARTDTKTYTDIERLKIGFRAVKKQPRTKSVHLEHIESVNKVQNTWKGKTHVWYRVYYKTPSGKQASIDIDCKKY